MLDFNNYSEVWWLSIAGPNAFMKEVCNLIEDNKSVFAVISSAFPFRWEFRDAVVDKFSTSHYTYFVDSAEDLSELSPGAKVVSLLNQTKLNDYIRCWNDIDRFQILNDLPEMEKALIWVRSIHDEHMEQWIEFLHDYLSYPEHKGVFVLEVVSDTRVPEQLSQRICKIDYGSFVSPADLRLFTSVISSMLYPEQEQEYVAALSALLCQTDPEIAVKLLEDKDLCDVNVLSKLEQIRSCFEDPNCGVRRGCDIPQHPFSLLDCGNQQALENKIWTAQLRVAFPIIEVERQQLIAKYESELHDALSHSYLDRKSGDECKIENEIGEQITDPFDLEIGKLYFMTKVFRYPGACDYFWKGTTLQDRKRISYLRDRRNDLAHLHVIKATDFRPLLYPETTP